MKWRQFLFVANAVLLFCAAAHGQALEAASGEPRRIAVWGSSVADGAGDELDRGGYAGRLAELLGPRGWEVFDQSRGGDNTVTITPRFEPGETPDAKTRYLTAVDPTYVVIGLSLGNEGIAQCRMGQTHRCTTTTDEAEAILEQFTAGLRRLIERSRAAGITPIVTLPYARLDFFEREYAYTRRANLLINTWDVPSVNLLGAVDDGQGRWARGLWADPYHPNAAGHTELLHAFVPSLFAALEAGKPRPVKPGTTGFARVRSKKHAPMSFEVEDTMRSFALTFMVRVRRDGAVAAIEGQTLYAQSSLLRRSHGDFAWDTESIDLRPGVNRFAAILDISDGSLTYTSSDGKSVSSPLIETDSGWHYVTVSHYAARGETALYLDGELVGAVAERLQPDRFVLGGAGETGARTRPARADYRDWMLHRAGLNAEEVVALHDGLLLQASLELYLPLAGSAENLAQSLSVAMLDPSSVTFHSP